jgi:hypothetical protein
MNPNVEMERPPKVFKNVIGYRHCAPLFGFWPAHMTPQLIAFSRNNFHAQQSLIYPFSNC